MPKLSAIAKEIDRRAEFRPIGRLQELRKELNGLGRIPDHRIFSWRKKIDEDGYSFHLGGRTELQFNIGLEYLKWQRDVPGGRWFLSRHKSDIAGNGCFGP